LARIVETDADGILIIDRDGRITQARRRRRRESRLAARRHHAAHLQRRPPGRSPPVDGKPVRESEFVFARIMATGQPIYGVERLIGPGRQEHRRRVDQRRAAARQQRRRRRHR